MYCFIVNPKACRAISEKIWKQLERQLKIMKIDYQAYLTQNPGDARRFARELTNSGESPAAVIVVGGDGTMNEVLDGISFTGNVMVGYIPIGLNNNLARSLKLPGNPYKCLKRIISSGHVRYLDYGVLSYGENAQENRRFAVSCGIGLDTAGVLRLPEIKCGRWKPFLLKTGRLGGVLTGIRRMLAEKPAKGFIILDDVKKVEFNHIFLVTVHIHPYGNGRLKFAPKADPADGSMEVCVIHNARKLQLGRILIDAFLGRLRKRKGVRFFSCREVQVHTERPMPVHVDGEDCRNQTDIYLRCVEKKIRMII